MISIKTIIEHAGNWKHADKCYDNATVHFLDAVASLGHKVRKLATLSDCHRAAAEHTVHQFSLLG